LADQFDRAEASPSRSNSAEKKESTVRRLSQLCPPCATPSSNSSLDYPAAMPALSKMDLQRAAA
jgi:hypothetical protein